MILRKNKIYIKNLKKKIEYLKKKEKMLSINIETKSRNLYLSNLSLKSINNQMNEIFLHMNDGFFSIDKSLTIGKYFSSATTSLLNIKKPADMNLIDIISKFLNKKNINSARDYFELMFNKDVEEYTLMEINPLDVFEVPYLNEKGQQKRRFINLSAARVVIEGVIEKVIIKLQDVTEQEELNQELKESESNKKLIMDLMIDVIASDPEVILEYILESEKDILALNEIMRNPDDNEFSEILKEVGKIVHRMKGGALSLNLNLIITDIHKFEDEIKQLNENENVSGEDLIALIFNIQKLQEYFNEIRNLVKKLSKFNTDAYMQQSNNEKSQINRYESDKISDLLKKMTSVYNQKYNESVLINIDLIEALPSYLYETIKTVLIHLLNNSYGHGLDTTESRVNMNKTPNMMIEISSRIDRGCLYVNFKDDGKGIDVEEVRKVIIEKYNKTEDFVKNKKSKEIIRYLFLENFSTTQEVSEISGRGMGLPIIYSMIKKQSGKLNIQFKKGQFTSFTMVFPLLEDEVYA